MSNTHTFKAGDEVYDIHGRAGCYVARASGGHIVEPAYDDDGEPTFDDAQTWREVFAKPPVEKLHADVAAAEAKLRGLHEQVCKARADMQAAEAQEAATRKRIASNPQLVDLDLWLQGKVTHIVALESYALQIGTIEEVLAKKERYDTSFRLLNLRCDPKERRYWTSFASYSDGSGSQTRCLLATSLEHAKELAAAYIAALPESDSGRESMASTAIDLGVEVSDSLRALVAARKAKRGAEQIAAARSDLERAQANLAALQARHPEVTA